MSRRATSQRFSPWFSDWTVLNFGMSLGRAAVYLLVWVAILTVVGFFAWVLSMAVIGQFFDMVTLRMEGIYRRTIDQYFIEALYNYARAWVAVFVYFVGLLTLRWLLDALVKTGAGLRLLKNRLGLS